MQRGRGAEAQRWRGVQLGCGNGEIARVERHSCLHAPWLLGWGRLAATIMAVPSCKHQVLAYCAGAIGKAHCSPTDGLLMGSFCCVCVAGPPDAAAVRVMAATQHVEMRLLRPWVTVTRSALIITGACCPHSGFACRFLGGP